MYPSRVHVMFSVGVLTRTPPQPPKQLIGHPVRHPAPCLKSVSQVIGGGTEQKSRAGIRGLKPCPLLSL